MTTNSIARIYVAVALLIIILAIGGCATPPVYDLSGTVTCSNCGTTKDGLLRIESVSTIRSLKIVITNLSEEPIYLDERYFSFTDSNEVQPLEAWLKGALITKSVSSNYEVTEATNRTERSNFSLFGISNRATGVSTSENITKEVAYNPIIIIPKQSNYVMYCNDWYGYLFDIIKQNNLFIDKDNGTYVLDTIATRSNVRLLQNRPLGITLVYRKLNDTQWSNATVTLQSPDISMTAITKKSKSSKK